VDFKKVGDNFTVSFACKSVTCGDELLLELLVIFDNAVVHHCNVVFAGGMRVGVAVSHAAVRCPAGVADANPAEIRQTIEESTHSLLPVAEGSPDTILGVVKVRDVLAALVAGRPARPRDMMRKVEVVPDQLDAMDALRVLQSAEVAMAVVHDEYGHFEGIVTPVDLLTAIVGNFASDSDDGDLPSVVEREDGSLLVSGSLSADALADRLRLEYGEDREFGTAAGYALSVLKKLPQEGEHFTDQGWRFEVVDMDGRRIDKLLVSRVRGDD